MYSSSWTTIAENDIAKSFSCYEHPVHNYDDDSSLRIYGFPRYENDRVERKAE